jgi:hypothetical protein
MAKIKGALADLSTEFQVVDPGIYELEVKKISEKKKTPEGGGEEEVVGYRFNSQVMSEGPMKGKMISEYVHVGPDKDGNPNEIGLQQVKRYFEGCLGLRQTKKMKDDDYDTDMLIGRRFRGDVRIESYTPQGQTQARQSNRIAAFETV